MSREAWVKRDSTLSVERDGEGYRDMDVYLMWRVWPAAQADAYERPTTLRGERACSNRNHRAAQCHDAIRALAKETGK